MKEPPLELLERYCDGHAAPDEMALVEDWLHLNSIDPQDLRVLLRIPDGLRFMLSIDRSEEWLSLKPRLPQRYVSDAIGLVWRIAASVALIALTTYLVFKPKFLGDDYVFVHNTHTIMEKLILPDSSIVYLNRGAKIKYPRNFGHDRDVSMNGEVYFEVKHDPSKPFSISAGKWKASVLGTSFNILGDSTGLALTVTTGKVVLQASGAEVILLPGEKGSYSDSTGVCMKEINRERNFIAWKTRELIFDNSPMPGVLRDLEKYFNIEIEIGPEGLGQLPRYTSSFKDPTLLEVLEEMKTLLPIDYAIQGRGVTITRK